MDFKQLEAFVTAVDEGSFSNAANRLQVSQSMVTIHIRNLEKELGTRLLNRTTRSMELSEDGRAFYDYARRMLKLNRESILSLQHSNLSGSALDIITTPFICRYYLAERISAFRQLHPEASFQIGTGFNSELQGRLDREGVPLVFSNIKIMNAGYAVHRVTTAKLVVITANAPKFRALPRGSFPAELFGKEPIITRCSSSPMQREFLRWRQRCIPDTRLTIAASVDDTESIKRLVADGVGISILAEVAVRDEVSAGRLLAFPLEEATPFHLYFACKKRYLSPLQREFCDWILASFRAAGEEPPAGKGGQTHE